MKKTLQVLFCVAVLLFTLNEANAQKKKKKDKKESSKAAVLDNSTSGDVETMLVKKWQFDGEYLKNILKQEAEKIKATDPDKANEIASQAEMMSAFASMITMEYKSGGVMEMGVMGEVQAGTWKLEDSNKTIVQTNSDGSVTRFIIKLITADKLQIENSEAVKSGDPMAVIQLIPAK